MKAINKLKYLPIIALVVFCSCKKSYEGTSIVDAQIAAIPPNPINNTDMLYNGVNLQPSYYNNGNPNLGWSLMTQQPKIKTVRIEIEPNRVGEGRTWIAQAKSSGYTVIATYHKSAVLGSDDANELLTAAKWWRANYVTLGGNFVINLMNEWGSHDITPSQYAAAYNDAITIVRTVYAGPIIIDIPGYGQETYTASQACTTSATKITDANIYLSTHVYPNGYNKGRSHNLQPSDMNDIAASGKKGIIGEFGNQPTGSVDWSGIVDAAKAKGYPVLGWAWNGDGGPMNMVDPSWAAGGSTATTFTMSTYFNTIYNKL